MAKSKPDSKADKITLMAKLLQSFMAKSRPDSKAESKTAKEYKRSTYVLLEPMSRRGSSGEPQFRAWNRRTKKMVAMRQELNPKRLSRTTEAEVETLETLGPHPCILACDGTAVTADGRLFVAMEYVKSDLERLRKERRKPYSLNQISHVIKHVLHGVAFLHENDVVHGDLSPANVLIDGDGSRIKICGLARHPRVGGNLWYKAPELLFGSGARTTYTWAVDMWSVGCIMAEMLVDHVFFMGFSDADQLECIRRAMEPPGEFLCRKIAAAKHSEAAVKLTPAGFDLLERLLTYEADMRITAREALDHAWFHE